jgi:hypothetical protein
MKKLFSLCLLTLAGLAVCAAANPVKGPWGHIVPSPDPTRYDRMICDVTPGPLYIYLICAWPTGSTAVEFSAPKPSCFTGVYLGDTPVFPVTIGNSQYGVSVGFGACRTPPVHVLTMMYYGYGTTPADCVYETIEHPVVGWVSIVDCNFNQFQASRGGNFVNPPEAGCGTIPVETMTWGQVKSLFTE